MLRNDKQKEAIVKLWLSKKNIGHGYNKKYFCYENKIAPKTLNNYVRQYNETQHVAAINKSIKNKSLTDCQHPLIKNQVSNNLTRQELVEKINSAKELNSGQTLDAKFHLILNRLDALCEHFGIVTKCI